jgi:hypothetical protein
MIPKRFSGLSILLILALLISSFAVVMPAAPVHAAATSVSVTSPTSGSPARSHATAGTGSVTVIYDLPGPGTDSNSIFIQIISGTLVAGTASETKASGTTGNTISVPILVSASAGTYDVVIQDGNGHTNTSTASVIINNTAPILPAPTMPTSTVGWSSASTSVHNTLSFSVSSQSAINTVTVESSFDQSTWTVINTFLNAAIPTTPATFVSYTGYLVPGTGPIAVGESRSFYIRITVTDQFGNRTQSPFGAFTLSPSGPIVTINAANPLGPGNSTNQTFNTGQTATPIVWSFQPAGGAGQYQIGLFASGMTGTPDVLLNGGFQSAVNGISGTWTGNTYNGNFAWTVPTTVRSTNCYIGVQGKDSVGNIGNWAYCANPFRVIDNIKPTATVLWPTSGSVHYAGNGTDNVTWSQSDNVPGNLSAIITLSLDGGTTIYQYIPAVPQGQGVAYTTWSVPSLTTSSTNCVITLNVSDSENPANVYTVRSSAFTIVVPQIPTVTNVTSPASAAQWPIGSTQTVTFTANDPSSTTAQLTYTIALSTGAAFQTVMTTQPMAQGYNSISISVPDIAIAPYSASVPYNGAIIKVTATNAASGQSSVGISSASFSITAASFPVLTSAPITLYPGWNLVSLPLIPTNTNIQNVLSQAMPYIASVWTCTGGGTSGGTWSYFAPGVTSSLTTMVDGKAYWINLNGSTNRTFTFQGRKGNPPPSSPPTYTITTPGWYMIGYKSTVSTHQVHEYLGNPTSGSTTIYTLPITGFNAAATPQAFTTLYADDTMTTGQGYWVYYNSAGAITPPSD